MASNYALANRRLCNPVTDSKRALLFILWRLVARSSPGGKQYTIFWRRDSLRGAARPGLANMQMAESPRIQSPRPEGRCSSGLQYKLLQRTLAACLASMAAVGLWAYCARVRHLACRTVYVYQCVQGCLMLLLHARWPPLPFSAGFAP